jgi:hypothetical protein
MKAAFLAILIALIAVIAYAGKVDFTPCGGYLTIDRMESDNWPPVKGKHFASVTYLNNNSGKSATFDGTWLVQTKWNGMNADSQNGSMCKEGFGDIPCGTVVANGGSLAVLNEGELPASSPDGTYVVRTQLFDSQNNVMLCYTTTFKV